MSPLRESNCKQKHRKGIDAKLPSPNSSNDSLSLAQGSDLRIFCTILRKEITKLSTVEGTSLFTLRNRSWLGSMTVEAALVLPVFLIFFLNLASVIEIMRLHGRVEMALWAVGRELCLYGSALRDTGMWDKEVLTEKAMGTDTAAGTDRAAARTEGILSQLGDLALSYTYIKGAMEDYLGKDYLDNAPLRGGSGGLQFLGTDMVNGEDALEIVVTYQAMPSWTVPGFRSFLMENRYYGRLWTGFQIQASAQNVYYLTENREVFHASKNCTHLLLSVRRIPRESLGQVKSSGGAPYRACEKCGQEGDLGMVWIPKEGECYHTRRDCPGLNRIYREVTWEEAQNYRPCSRCGQSRERAEEEESQK